MRLKLIRSIGLVIGLIVVVMMLAPAAAQDGEKISRPGVYQGYSQPMYDSWVRSSIYVEVRDGTKLAVDIFRPTENGEPTADPLPVIWTHHRYHRAVMREDGQVSSIVDDAPALRLLLRHGYVVAAVDVRGGGASYGTRRGEFSPEETLDAYDMTEWFAAQPWCDGNVGMYGLSYLGITQYMAASTQPPHLKAIFPMMAMYDMYGFAYPGGVFNNNFILNWSAGNFALDKVMRAAPVGEDVDQTMLDEAMAQHQDNWNIYTLALDHPYRDSVVLGDAPIYSLLSPSTYLDQINNSGVAIYTLAGWYDLYTRDAVTWFNNLTVPQKLIITPWSHTMYGAEFEVFPEHLRWYDYWLKGIDNGIMDEPPIYYYVMGAPPETAWRFAETWPLPEQQLTPFYLSAGPVESVASVNDGGLSLEPPVDAAAQDDYVVDYSTTTGPATRWTAGYGGGFDYPDMTANDQKALTYTSAPLEVDTQITGHPVAHLWITASAEDADVIVYLEEVNANGVSHYLSEGTLRLSYRALNEAPWNTMGLPFHRGNQADVAPLPTGELTELVIDLLPTSNIFDAGNRIRISITGADVDTYLTPGLDPPPTLSLYRSAENASYIELPVIPAE